MKITLIFIIGVLAILCANQHYETNAAPAVIFSSVPLGTVIGNRLGLIRRTTRGPTTVISKSTTTAAPSSTTEEATTEASTTEASTTEQTAQ